MINLVKRRIELGATTIVLVDSIMMLDSSDAGAIIVSSSHGGLPAAFYALKIPLRAAFFNDAGVGKDDAGIAGLAFLDTHGIPAGAVSHVSARIGDVEDMWENGKLSHLNDTALRAGVKEAMTLAEAIDQL